MDNLKARVIFSHHGDMNSREKLPDSLAGRSFAVLDAQQIGLGRSRTRASDLLTPSRGIRVPWGVSQTFLSVVSPILQITPSAVLCHGSAARLWALPLPSWLENERHIHLAKISRNTGVKRFGVRSHRLALGAGEVDQNHGIRVTSPARTWLDLAEYLSFEELVAVGDAIVCRHQRSFGPMRPALATLAELAAIIDGHSGARNIRKARQALAVIRVGADSPPETYLRLAMVAAGMPEPELNVVLRGADGNDVAWPDFD